MLIITTAAAIAIGAAASMAYMRYVSARSQGRPIFFASLRHGCVPPWVDLMFIPAWLASACVLCFTLPLWVGSALYCGAALLPAELMRRRHNRQVKDRLPLSAPADENTQPLTVSTGQGLFCQELSRSVES
ncbi:hypothetical protein ABZT48_00825 [Streptomyces avermitilis]|uniref:hypothetical protein n=1 Tax=Streptomyces avermitilis TaxID=33903 RepID=UPI0033ABB6D8